MTHTPAPWTLSGPFGTNDYDDSEGFYRVEAARTLDLLVGRCSDGYVDGETAANARLIAAAPDLLSALESAEDALAEHCPGLTYLLDGVISPALAKARGETA